MSLEHRLKIFYEILSKNRSCANRSSFAARYQLLVLKRRLFEVLLSSLLIFGGQQFIIQNHFFSPVWPAAGVGLSALFLRGNFILFGVFLGVFTSFLYYRLPWLTSLMQGSAFIAFLYLFRQVALRWIGAVIPLAKWQDLWKFFGLTALFSAAHAYATLLIGTTDHQFPVFFKWYVAWLGEMNGIFCLTPLCFIFNPFIPQRFFQQQTNTWWIIALILIFCHFLYFVIPSGTPSFAFSLIMLILMGIYAYQFGQIPTCLTLLGISVVYFSGVMIPPHLFHFTSTPQQVKMLLSLFTLTTIFSLAIATAREFSGRRRASSNRSLPKSK